MQRLYFKRIFKNEITSGRKTTTLRRWRSERVSAGQCVLAPGIGQLKIISCDCVDFDRLGAADARADGFRTLGELRALVYRIYPNHKTDGKQWFRVTFLLEKQIKTPTIPRKSIRHAALACSGKFALQDDARLQLASRVRDELDKAVQRNGSLAAL